MEQRPGGSGTFIVQPIRGGELYNIFAGHVSEDWVEESWSVPSSIDELLDGYAGWNEALLRMLSHTTQCFKWGIRASLRRNTAYHLAEGFKVPLTWLFQH